MQGYRATKNADGTMTIHDVPIFCECSRRRQDGELQVFDRDWIQAAVARAQQAETEGYLAPMHIRHHKPGGGEGEGVKASGHFKVTGTSIVTLKGKRRLAVMADLIVTCPEAEAEVLAKRLPYRSVEIFNVDEPNFDGLALLDHEAPFLELPMTMIASVEEQEQGQVFESPWELSSRRSADEPMVACFSRGRSATMLFREDAMSDDEDDHKKEQSEEDSVNMEDGEATMNAEAVIKAIEDGSISIADFDAIKVAMAAREGGAEEAAEEEPELAPAPVPGGDVMSRRKEFDPKAQARIDMLEARLDARDALEKRNADVSMAMKRMEDRVVGSDFERRCQEYHEKHGADAFEQYIDELDRLTPPSAGLFSTGNATRVSGVVAEYEQHGPKAVSLAQQASAEYQQLAERGLTNGMTEKRYIDIAMKRGMN